MRFLNRMIGAILSCCVVAFAGFSGLAQAAASLKQPEPSGSVGVQTIMTNNAVRSDPVAVSIWYPADKAGATTMIGGNAVFDGVSAIPDAGFANGKFPAVLIAHGGMGSAPHPASGSRMISPGAICCNWWASAQNCARSCRRCRCRNGGAGRRICCHPCLGQRGSRGFSDLTRRTRERTAGSRWGRPSCLGEGAAGVAPTPLAGA